MNNNLYVMILNQLQKEIKENSEELKRLQSIDNKYFIIKIEEEKILKIIEYYKSKETNNLKHNINIYCNGNPYNVLNIAMVAINNNCNIIINIDDVMLGVNKLLISIINNILKKNNIKLSIEILNKIENDNKTIFIDRINEFEILKEKTKNIKFISFQGIDIFSSDEEFEELFEKIYNYAIEMNIDIDIFDEEGIDGLFKYGKNKNKLIFTRNEEIIKKYKGKNIYINENPFKNEKIIFDDEVINKIINI